MKYSQVPSLHVALTEQLNRLKEDFSKIASGLGLLGVLLVGSCSRDEATYNSDIDLLLVLDKGPLNYSRTCDLRDQIEASLSDEAMKPLPLQMHFILASAFETEEPAMKAALRRSRIMMDSKNVLENDLKKLRSGAKK